ncbi:hypothetical protein HPB48_005077 [Haemaphysalis longicornis]|uniref:Uncharacterized protein n=1 Tax=Haemaphysalis longicornis TaxID=44386 RepID=A0A9J6FFB2_HAELO|nr:hypothetical protein HPB48_005077 [Haemaphysalis longicornis]
MPLRARHYQVQMVKARGYGCARCSKIPEGGCTVPPSNVTCQDLRCEERGQMALRQDDTGATFRAGNPTGKRQHTVDYYDVLRSFPTSFTACTIPTPNIAAAEECAIALAIVRITASGTPGTIAPPTFIKSHHDWETALRSNDPEIQLRLVRLALDAPAPVARPHEGTGVSGRAGPGGLGRSHTGR